jgi:hypothetical protein
MWQSFMNLRESINIRIHGIFTLSGRTGRKGGSRFLMPPRK